MKRLILLAYLAGFATLAQGQHWAKPQGQPPQWVVSDTFLLNRTALYTAYFAPSSTWQAEYLAVKVLGEALNTPLQHRPLLAFLKEKGLVGPFVHDFWPRFQLLQIQLGQGNDYHPAWQALFQRLAQGPKAQLPKDYLRLDFPEMQLPSLYLKLNEQNNVLDQIQAQKRQAQRQALQAQIFDLESRIAPLANDLISLRSDLDKNKLSLQQAKQKQAGQFQSIQQTKGILGDKLRQMAILDQSIAKAIQNFQTLSLQGQNPSPQALQTLAEETGQRERLRQEVQSLVQDPALLRQYDQWALAFALLRDQEIAIEELQKEIEQKDQQMQRLQKELKKLQAQIQEL
jgi:hypothetical protein